MPLEVAEGIATWLLSRQARGGRITDSVHQVPGTYADGFAALTFALLGWHEARDVSLQISLNRSPQSEFDSLAQALILQVAAEGLAPAQLMALQGRPLYQGAAVVSNNWAAFRALTRLLRGLAGSDFSVLQGQLATGMLPDSPFGIATPVCYHAKMCAVVALAQVLKPQVWLGRTLEKALNALIQLVSPSGVLVPYGRSRNTLFGYGAAFLALQLGAGLYNSPTYAWGASRILERLRRHQSVDGHLPAVLNDSEWLRSDWDIYINNPDYNAFASACLLLGWKLCHNVPSPKTPPNTLVNLGPVLVCRQKAGFFACSTVGEYAPFASPFFCDTRYAGLAPLVFDDGDQVRLFDENYCWDGRDSTRSCLVDPRVAPFIPYAECEQRRYWVRTYEDLRQTWDGEVLTICGAGIPVHSDPSPRWLRFLSSRLTASPVAQMRDRELEDRWETTLSWNTRSRELLLSTSSQKRNGLIRSRWGELVCPT